MEKSFRFNEGKTNIKSPIFGIDLGTTNSVISYMSGKNKDVPEVVTWAGDKFIVQSCVRWDGGDKFTVGEIAYKERYKKSVAYSAKTHMGSNKKFTLVHEAQTLKMTPEMISAEVLKELKRKAEEKFGKGIVKDVIITVPAYFDSVKREATLKAGSLAGLNVLGVINEPTAASLAYGLDKAEGTQNVMVYDLGGGTFDITVFKFSNSSSSKVEQSVLDVYGFDNNAPENSSDIVEVLATNGHPKLGGDNIDEEFFNILVSKVNEKVRKTFGKAKFKWESKLTDEEKKKIILGLEDYKKSGGLGVLLKRIETEYGDIEIPLSNSDLEDAIRVTLNKTLILIDETLEMDKVRGIKIDKIILVGGSTQSEIIRKTLKDKFINSEFYLGLDPDKSISLGASVYASVLEGDLNLSIIDVNPIPIGLLTENDRFDVLVKQNQILPYEVTKTYTTDVDEAISLLVGVYQGKSMFCSNNVKIGDLVINTLPKKKSGDIIIDLKLCLDLNGVLKIKVRIDGEEHVKELSNVNGGVSVVKEESVADTMMKAWEMLGKRDSELKELLDKNKPRDEIIEYLRNKRKKMINEDESVRSERDEIKQLDMLYKFNGQDIE